MLIGDTTAGNAVIANLRTLAGATTGFDDWIGDGDYLWADPQESAPMFSVATNRIVDFNGPARTCTMSGNAARTQTGFRLGLLIRAM